MKKLARFCDTLAKQYKECFLSVLNMLSGKCIIEVSRDISVTEFLFCYERMCKVATLPYRFTGQIQLGCQVVPKRHWST